MLRHLVLPVSGLILVGALFAGQAAPARPAPANVEGKRLFLRCASCHAIAGNPPGRIGPTLENVVGRKAGSVPGYNYSPAMRQQTIKWDKPTLDRWLTRPSAVVPGTAMAFAGLPNPQDRKALIEYLDHPGK